MAARPDPGRLYGRWALATTGVDVVESHALNNGGLIEPFVVRWGVSLNAENEEEARQTLVQVEAHLGRKLDDLELRPIPDPLPPPRYSLEFATALQIPDAAYGDAVYESLSLASRLGLGWEVDDPTPFQDGYIEFTGRRSARFGDLGVEHSFVCPEIRTARFILLDVRFASSDDAVHLRKPRAEPQLGREEALRLARLAFPGSQLWDHDTTVEYGSLTVDRITRDRLPIGTLDVWKIKATGFRVRRPSGGVAGAAPPALSTLVVLVDDKAGQCLQGIGT
jgi:hypothetical protein